MNRLLSTPFVRPLMPRRFFSLCLAGAYLAGVGGAATGCTATGSKGGADSGTKNAPISQGATIGALSGAAVGGGVGAIIGSTSGHLGEGIAVGALAGGVAGAGVGAAVGDYKSKQTARQDTVNDQKRQFKEQRRDLDSVKDSLGDEMSYQNRSKSSGATIVSSSLPVESSRGAHLGQSGMAGSSGYGSAAATGQGYGAKGYGIRENYRGNPQAKPYAAGYGRSIPASVRQAQSSERARLSEHASQSYASARSVSSAGPVKRVAFAKNSEAGPSSERQGASAGVLSTTPPRGGLSHTAATSAAKTAGEPPLLDNEGDEPPMRTVDPVTGTVKNAVSNAGVTSKSAVSAGSGITSGELPAAATVSKGAGSDIKGDGAVVAKELGKVGAADSSASCIQAEKEAARATNAASDADRLFYLGRATRLCPNSDTYQVELGKIFTKIGKIQEAKAAFKKAAELNPQNDVAHDELSILENSTQ